jgi:hypothetical protein
MADPTAMQQPIRGTGDLVIGTERYFDLALKGPKPQTVASAGVFGRRPASAMTECKGGVVCQNRAAPRAPVKLMSNRAETARQNHAALDPPPCQN